MANRTVSITTIPTRSDGDTVASYNVYTDKPGVDTLVGTLTPAEALAGKTLVFADGLNHNVTAKTVWTTAGESTTNISNILVVDLGSSVGWSLLGSSYDSVNLDISANTTSPTGLFFKPDGLKMYVTDNANAQINEYTLSTAWLLSSQTLVTSQAVTSTAVSCLMFNTTGTKVFFSETTREIISQATLSTAWDISTIGAITRSSAMPINDGIVGFRISLNGLKIFTVGKVDAVIREHSLSTAFDVTTINTTATNTYDAIAQDTGFHGIEFSDDGLKMYVIGETASTVVSYTLSVAFDLSSTITSTGNSLAMGTQDTDHRGLFIKPDGLKLYSSGITANASIYQYSLT